MILDWLRRLVTPPEKAPAAGRRSHAREARPGDRFDPLEIAEYDIRTREPLSPDDSEHLSQICEVVRRHFYEHGRDALAIPPRAGRFVDLIQDPECDVNKLVQLVSQDQVVSASVLRLANAASHGAGASATEARGIREAIVRLGVRETVRVALAVSMKSLFDPAARAHHAGFARSWQRLWVHSMTVSSAAGWLAMTCRRGDVERAFLGGLMHDIGKTFALRSLGDLALSGDVAGDLPEALVEAAMESLHLELGEEVARSFGLPGYVVDVCREHHNPPEAPGAEELHMIRLVSGLDEIRLHPSHRAGLAGDVIESARVLGLDGRRARPLLTQIRESARRIAAI